MSTSIAANVGPRPAVPESHLNQPPAPPAHEESKPNTPHPVDGIPFASPVIKVDNDTGLALLVVRNSSTGEEVDQYPSKKAVAEYERVQSSTSVPPSQATPADNGQSLATDAKAPPAPVTPVAAPPASPETSDAVSAPSGGSGVKPVSL